jgi:hypothetical protein
MSFSSIQSGRYGFEKQTTSSKKQIYGATMALPDGRVFRYVENGGTAIGEGLVVASEAPAGNHDEDLVVATSGSAGGFQTAITAGTDTVGLIKSPYKDIVVAPAAVAGRFVGVTCADLEADYFGWVQVAGIASVKIDGTPAVGTLVGASSNHAGQLLAVGADTTPALGRLHGKAGVDNEFHTVFLMNLH